MRSLVGKNPHLVIVWLIALLFFFAWSGIAQEVKELDDRAADVAEDIIDIPAPDFAIVAPLNKDVLSGKGIFIIKPSLSDPNLVAAVQLESPQGNYEAKFVESENWMHAVDTTQLQNGEYTATISLCTQGVCEKKEIIVVIENKRDPSTPAGETPSTGGTEPLPSETPEKPVEPSEPVESIQVIPSNHAGAFYLSNRSDQSFSFKSSGDALKIIKGSYDAKFEFFEGRVASIKVSGAKLDHDGIIAQWSENAITQKFFFNEQAFEPVESYWFRFGFPAEDTAIQFSPLPEYAFIWCRSWEKDAGVCTRAEILDDEADNPLVNTTENEMILVFAKRVDTQNNQPRYHTIVPSNLKGKFIFEQKDSGEVLRTTHEGLELRAGEYDVNAYFEDLPIQFVHMRSLGVDHNDVLLQFPFVQRTPDGIVTLALDEPYAFSSGFFAISRDYAEGSIWTCPLWNAAAQDCLGAWSRTYETRMQKGTMFLRFYPPGVDVNETEIPPVLPPTGGEISDEAALLQAIARLKDLSLNSAYFKSDSALNQFTILDVLFSDIEVSLECDPSNLVDPATKPIPKPVPVEPNDSIVPPASTTDSVTPTIDETAAPESDANITLSFQAEDSQPDIIPIADTPSLPARDDIADTDPIFVEPAPRPAFEEVDTRFSSAWEDGKPPRAEGNEDDIECDGVTLHNAFVEQRISPENSRSFPLGDMRTRLKQTLALTNNTFLAQQRTVHVRLFAKAPALVAEKQTIIPAEDYVGLRTKVEVDTILPATDDSNAPPVFVERLKHFELELVDENAQVVGKYNWKDYWDANTSPITLVHTGKEGTIIDTLIHVKVDPSSSRIIDPTYELVGYPNFSAAWDGNNSNDLIGNTFDSNEGIRIVNLDNNAVANDLIIVAPMADYNGKLDAGAVYIIKDFNRYTDLKSLADTNNYDVAFFGGTAYDYLGRTGIAATGSSTGVQLFDTDGNGYANDLILTAINADVNGKGDAGAVYYIKNVDRLKGSFGLASMNGISVRWNGTTGGDRIGYTVQGGLGVQVANLDANVVANDLIIGSAQGNVSSQADNGMVYVIKDINTIGGPIDVNRMRDLNHPNNFSVRFDANTIASENLTNTSLSGNGIKVVNTDRNVVANDLIIQTTLGDANGKTDAGKIYYVKDVNTLSGIIRFNNTANFQAMWHGGASWGLGSTSGSGNGLFMLDLNGDGFNNDMLVVANQGDFNFHSDNGVLFLIPDINSISGVIDLNNNIPTNYNAKWYSGVNTDRIGYYSPSFTVGDVYADSIQVVNLDGNATSNDLIITASLADFNAKTDAGVIYLVKDINAKRGNLDLNIPANYSLLWHGEAASDNTGRNNNREQSVQVVNIDGNLYANDLLITSVLADVNGKTNAGGVYLVADINAKSGLQYLGNFNHIDARWNGAAGEFLGDTNGSGQGVQLVNIDNNLWANDLIITAPSGDANGYSDNGIVYLIRDINRYKAPTVITSRINNHIVDLNSPARGMFAAKWYPDSNRQFLGDTNRSGRGAIIANTDNNAYANDLIITASKSDSLVLGGGEIYYIRDIDKVDGNRPLSQDSFFFSEFHGDTNFDGLGDTNASGAGVIIADVDGNGYTNDLIISAYNKDINVLGQADKNLVFANGGVFLIRDIVNGSAPKGVFTYNFNTPGLDANVYGVNETIVVNATVFCRGAACGNVDTNLQYCVGNSCQYNRFMDMNTVSGSPLYILSGSATQSQSNMLANGSYDVNWTITGASDYNYELRLSSIGTTAVNGYSDGTDRTIVLEPANSFDFGRRSSYYARYFGSLNNGLLGYAYNGKESVQLVNLDNGVYANDLIVVASFADFNAKTNNGAVYIIKNIDVNRGELDLNNTNYFDLRIQGGANSDQLGTTQTGLYNNPHPPGVLLLDLDANMYTNDLIITAATADVNGKSENGAIYILKDVDRKTGIRDLSGNATEVDARISGSITGDYIGWTLYSDQGVQIVNLDGNVVSNDLILQASDADINSKTGNGAIYIINDINTLRGSNDLNIPSKFKTVFMGGIAADALGMTFHGTSGVRLVNLDGNAWANDLIIGGDIIDTNGKTDVGAIYVVKDVNVRTGYFDFNNTNNYDLKFNGGMTTDGIGRVNTFSTGNDQNGWQLVNVDGNAWANDLLIAAYQVDNNGKTDVGAIYLVKDINAKGPGAYDFNNNNNFDVMYAGGRANDMITRSGFNTLASGQGWSLTNIDNGAYANDLYLISPASDYFRANSGSLYFIQNIDTNSGRKDLNNLNFFRSRYDASWTNDTLGDTNGSGDAVQLVNWDGGTYANDLILNVPFADSNNKTNSGAVYYVKNIEQQLGVKDLNTAANFQAMWRGAAAGDGIGDSNRSGFGVQIVNLDGNAIANDLLILAPRADINSKSENGGVYLILDANTKSGQLSFDTITNYTALWSGGSNEDYVGTAAQSGHGVQVVNLDNNANANDLLISAPGADISLKTNNGGVYLIQDANTKSGALGLVSPAAYTKRFVGRLSGNFLGAGWHGNGSARVINLDGNAYSNDLLFNSPFGDSNGKIDNGNITFLTNVLVEPIVVPDDYSFVLMLPSNSCNDGLGNQEGADGPCHRAWFEATDVIGLADENQVQADGQSNGVPFLQYDNQSSTTSDLNILLDVNESLPVTLILKVSKIFAGWAGTCTGNTDDNCARITTTATSVGRAIYSAGTQDLNLYVWGDFNGASTGRVDRNVDSNSIAS